MSTIKLSKTQHVKNILTKNPTLPAREVAQRANCDASIVYQVRNELKAKQAKSYADLAKAGAVVDSMVKERKDKVQPTYKENIAHTIDMINNPPHYTVGGIETIDFIQAKLSADEYRGFLKGTILAYASRLGHKDGTNDAGKITWYAKRLEAELQK